MNLNSNEARARAFGLALALSTFVGAIVAGSMLGLAVALLVVAAGALVLVIALLWASVAGLSGDTPLTLDEALGMGAPSAEEEQKRAVLRALKDLEYERSVGKISEDDYRDYSERYRAEARRLITALDVSLGPAQALAEKLAQERLQARGLGQSEGSPELAEEPAEKPAKESAKEDASEPDSDEKNASVKATEPSRPVAREGEP